MRKRIMSMFMAFVAFFGLVNLSYADKTEDNINDNYVGYYEYYGEKDQGKDLMDSINSEILIIDGKLLSSQTEAKGKSYAQVYDITNRYEIDKDKAIDIKDKLLNNFDLDLKKETVYIDDENKENVVELVVTITDMTEFNEQRDRETKLTLVFFAGALIVITLIYFVKK